MCDPHPAVCCTHRCLLPALLSVGCTHRCFVTACDSQPNAVQACHYLGSLVCDGQPQRSPCEWYQQRNTHSNSSNTPHNTSSSSNAPQAASHAASAGELGTKTHFLLAAHAISHCPPANTSASRRHQLLGEPLMSGASTSMHVHHVRMEAAPEVLKSITPTCFCHPRPGLLQQPLLLLLLPPPALYCLYAAF